MDDSAATINFASFLARRHRLLKSEIGCTNAIWALRDVLETRTLFESGLWNEASNKLSRLSKTDAKAQAKAEAKALSEFEGELWRAANWVVEGAGSLLKDMTSRRRLSEDFARAIRVGELYGDKNKAWPLSIDRWNFWKNRFAKLATLLDCDSETAQHVCKALRCMALAEKHFGHIPESESKEESEDENKSEGEDS